MSILPEPAASSWLDRLLALLVPALLLVLGSGAGWLLFEKLADAGGVGVPAVWHGLGSLLIGAGLAGVGRWLLRPQVPVIAMAEEIPVVPAVTPRVPSPASGEVRPRPVPVPKVEVATAFAGEQINPRHEQNRRPVHSPEAAPLPPLEFSRAEAVAPALAKREPKPAAGVIEVPPEFDKTGSALAQQRFQMLEDIAHELEGDVVFPTCFDLIVRLRELLQKPDFSLDQVAALVALDPLVSSKVLRQANGAAFGGQAVHDLRGAVSRLGIAAVRSIVMSIAMQQLLRAKHLVTFGALTHALWVHSVRTACAGRVIAKHLSTLNPEDAQLAGLVHDLGAFYMIYRAAQYEELRIRPESMKYLVYEWHESIGQSLLGALGMPEQIVNATLEHDQPRPLPSRLASLADVVYVANRIAGGQAGMLEEFVAPQNAALLAPYADLLPEIEAAAQEMLQVV